MQKVPRQMCSLSQRAWSRHDNVFGASLWHLLEESSGFDEATEQAVLEAKLVVVCQVSCGGLSLIDSMLHNYLLSRGSKWFFCFLAYLVSFGAISDPRLEVGPSKRLFSCRYLVCVWSVFSIILCFTRLYSSRIIFRFFSLCVCLSELFFCFFVPYCRCALYHIVSLCIHLCPACKLFVNSSVPEPSIKNSPPKF